MVQVSPLKMPIRSSLGLYLLPGPKYPKVHDYQPTDMDNLERLENKRNAKALVNLDGEVFDWTDHAEDKQENLALNGLQQFRVQTLEVTILVLRM
ncbi:hypothetical protein Tco_0896304 [Tanacetum coccineum]